MVDKIQVREDDPSGMMRLLLRPDCEAQVLASLNHPNIAAIYGIETGAIVMELVEGVDLAGPVPPRSEAREHQGHIRGHRETSGLRFGEADRRKGI